MKTKAQVLRENTEMKTIINAVIDRIGIDSSETHPFAMKYRKQIVSMLQNDASEFGQEIVEMVSGFGVFRQSKMDDEDKMELYKYIGGGKLEQSQITNLMAWYAAETVCRMFDE